MPVTSPTARPTSPPPRCCSATPTATPPPNDIHRTKLQCPPAPPPPKKRLPPKVQADHPILWNYPCTNPYPMWVCTVAVLWGPFSFASPVCLQSLLSLKRQSPHLPLGGGEWTRHPQYPQYPVWVLWTYASSPVVVVPSTPSTLWVPHREDSVSSKSAAAGFPFSVFRCRCC